MNDWGQETIEGQSQRSGFILLWWIAVFYSCLSWVRESDDSLCNWLIFPLFNRLTWGKVSLSRREVTITEYSSFLPVKNSRVAFGVIVHPCCEALFDLLCCSCLNLSRFIQSEFSQIINECWRFINSVHLSVCALMKSSSYGRLGCVYLLECSFGWKSWRGFSFYLSQGSCDFPSPLPSVDLVQASLCCLAHQFSQNWPNWR